MSHTVTPTTESPLTNPVDLPTSTAVVDDLCETLLAIATWGLHDSRRPELATWSQAVSERYDELVAAEEAADAAVSRPPVTR